MMVGDTAVPASKAWREGSSFRAISNEDSICSVNTAGTIHGLGSNEVTSVVTSDTADVVALAHTDPYNSRTNTSGVSFSLKTADRLHALGHLKTPSGITDMCWNGPLLLAASTCGSVLVYDTTMLNTDDYRNPDDLGDSVELKQTVEFADLQHHDHGAPPAGTYLRSQRVKQVCFAPLANSSEAIRFVAVDNNRLTRWDLHNTAEPEYSEVADALPIMCCELDQYGNLCMIGTTRGAMCLRDFRQPGAGSVWEVPKAHRGSLHEVLWSPFSPFWVASCGADAMVHVFDIRNNKAPMIRMAGHHNAVTEMSWSTSHAEILASGGWDRHVKIWNLNTSGQHMMDDVHRQFSTMIAGLDFCHKSHDTLIATSVSGEACCVTLTDEFLEPMVINKFESEQATDANTPVYALKSGLKVSHNETGVEKLFYFRQIKQACMLAINLAKTHQLSDEKLQDAKTLILLCKALDPVHCDNAADPSLAVSDLAQMRAIFREELSELSYRLPPGTEDIDSILDMNLVTEFAFLKESVDMLDDLAAARFGEFEDHKRRMLQWDASEWIKSTKKLLVLRRTIAEYLEADGPAAFKFAGIMCDKFAQSHKFLEFGLVADLLVHPSIYEHEGSKVTKLGQDSLVEHCKDYDAIRLQILLQELILEETAREGSDVAENIVRLVEAPHLTNSLGEEIEGLNGDLVDHQTNKPRVVSLAIIHCYFSALQLKESWDALIIQASNLELCVREISGYSDILEEKIKHGYTELLNAASAKTDDGVECLQHLVMIFKVVVDSGRDLNVQFITQVTTPVGVLCSTIVGFLEGCNSDSPSEAREFALLVNSQLGSLKMRMENEHFEKHAILEERAKPFIAAYANLINFATNFAESAQD